MNIHSANQSLEWAINYLTANEISILNKKIIAQTSYSHVYQIETSEGIFYLKQVPKMFCIEPKMLTFLQGQGCQNIPIVIAQNNELHCFLMIFCGDISLRHLFKKQINFDMLKRGIANYTKIQRSVENQTEQLLKMGVLDWRLNQFASLYSQLLQQEQLLIEDGLTKLEIDKLRELYPECMKLCSDLSEYRMPETINHCDFHENNMIIDHKTGEINIIDWGEVVLSHPFLSLNGCLWNITYFNEVNQIDLDNVKSQCIKPWLDLYEIHDLHTQLNLANQLNGIFAALTYEQVYRATKDNFTSAEQEKRGSIAGCLRTFSNNFNLK